MFGGVKITLIICLTIITSCVLFISYNEYSGRYSIVSTADNGIYIFDKKSTVLNRCDGKNCVVIETKLPTKTILNQDFGFQQSKLFESEKPMTAATLASNTTNPEAKSDNPENNKVSQDNEKELASPETTSDSKASSDSQATSTSEKTENTTNPSTDNLTSATSKEEKTENRNEDEFIE